MGLKEKIIREMTEDPEEAIIDRLEGSDKINQAEFDWLIKLLTNYYRMTEVEAKDFLETVLYKNKIFVGE
jgi:hypothetical protein